MKGLGKVLKSKAGKVYIKIEEDTKIKAGQVCFLTKPADDVANQLKRGEIDDGQAEKLIQRFSTEGDMSFIKYNISDPVDSDKPYTSFGKRLGQINISKAKKFYIAFNTDAELYKDSVIFLNTPADDIEFKLKNDWIDDEKADQLTYDYSDEGNKSFIKFFLSKPRSS